jgi:hypothetical protein
MAGNTLAAPLTQADFRTRPACAAPSTERAACLALTLEPSTAGGRAQAQARTTVGAQGQAIAPPATPQAAPRATECAEDYRASCLTPAQLRSAYFPGEDAEAPADEPQTIALVDAYNDPNAAADLALYEREFGIECKAADCFEQLNRRGESGNLPFPRTETELETFAGGDSEERAEAEEAEGWSIEIATDIEMARAICHNCHIVLLEAASPAYSELETAEDTAADTLHATEISNSWGGPEPRSDNEAFNHPGIPITGASGDNGYLNWDEYDTRHETGSPYFDGVNYPASSPHVISVGGTRLELTTESTWLSESVWNSEGAGGSGCSASLPAPEWQLEVSDWAQVGCSDGRRASNDIAADAEPATGVNVYDSTPYPIETKPGVTISEPPDWTPVGGTSVASPIIASMFALVGGAHGVAYPAQTLYSHLGTPALHDVTSGGTGECDDNYEKCSGSLASPLDCGEAALICNATTGYDGPTGVGTPDGLAAFKVDEAPVRTSKPIEEEDTTSGLGVDPGNPGAAGGGSGSQESVPDTSVKPGSGPARILALTLTAGARAAVRHTRVTISELVFSCTLSAAVTVRATLAVRVRSGGHTHWRTLPDTLAFSAAKGVNRRQLHGVARLAPGRYRLTLDPVGGKSRSIAIQVF